MTLESSAAHIVIDALLDRGAATWPGVGSFALLSIDPRPRVPVDTAVATYDFPRRAVAFEPLASFIAEVEAGPLSVPGFGSFARNRNSVSFRPTPGLRARLVSAPVLHAYSFEGPAAGEPAERHDWWHRLFR